MDASGHVELDDYVELMAKLKESKSASSRAAAPAAGTGEVVTLHQRHLFQPPIPPIRHISPVKLLAQLILSTMKKELNLRDT